MTDAHDQTMSAHYKVHYPAHDARKGDPHYHLFNAIRRKLEKDGKMICWICGTDQHIELHHDEVEFALANDIDLDKITRDFPEIEGDEEKFYAWIEGEGNLLALCADCHRSPYKGVHHVDGPNWKAQRYLKPEIELLGPVKNQEDK